MGKDLDDRVLPTFYDVMKYYIEVRDILMPDRNSNEATVFKISKIIIRKVMELWIKASIPTVSTNRAMYMLKVYHKKYMDIKKSIKKDGKKNKETFVNDAKSTLFDISSCKCANFSSCKCVKTRKVPEIEQSFLTDQRTLRNMVMNSVDVKTTLILHRRQERKAHDVMRATVSNDQPNKILTFLNEIKEEEGTDKLLPEIFDEDFNKPSTSGIKKSQMRIALSTVARECDRSGVSDRSAAKIASAVLKDIGMISENETSNIIDRSNL